MEEIVKSIIKQILIWLISSVLVYIGFNLLLPLVFDSIPKLSCSKIFILTIAIDFISAPIRMEIGLNMRNNLQ